MQNFTQEDIQRKITLKAGDQAPDFSLPNQDSVMMNLSDFRGKIVILYFYPKDETPGCTTESCEFSQNYNTFLNQDAVIIGISPDSAQKHSSFIANHNLNQTLLSDENKEVSKLYGVWQVRKNFGKEYLGIVRSTFVIGKDGKILKVYKSVKPSEHSNKVLEDLAKLS